LHTVIVSASGGLLLPILNVSIENL